MPTTSAAYPPEYFDKADQKDDALFYAEARLHGYLDAAAANALTTLYSEVLPENGLIFDMMSSFESYLPESMTFAEVIGLGMNSAELAANPRLTDSFVLNLNAEQALPFDSESVDAVLCANSIEYLQKPLEVFSEIHRILKPGGCIIVAVSRVAFPEKAIQAWTTSGVQERVSLLNSYFQLSAEWETINARLMPPTETTNGLIMLWTSKPLESGE